MVDVHPANPTVLAFNNVTLTCEIVILTDYETLTTYNWYRVGDDIPAKSTVQHSDKLTIPKVVPADEGRYYCVAKRYGHCAISKKTKVTVNGKKITLSI